MNTYEFHLNQFQLKIDSYLENEKSPVSKDARVLFAKHALSLFKAKQAEKYAMDNISLMLGCGTMTSREVDLVYDNIK